MFLPSRCDQCDNDDTILFQIFQRWKQEIIIIFRNFLENDSLYCIILRCTTAHHDLFVNERINRFRASGVGIETKDFRVRNVREETAREIVGGTV